MDDQVEYIPITAKEGVETTLAGKALERRQIPDFRALIDGIRLAAEEQATPLDTVVLRCVSCNVMACDCHGLEIPFAIDLGTPTRAARGGGRGPRHKPTVFDCPTDFARAVFSRGADFACAHFTQPCDFTGATFCDRAEFSYAEFQGELMFDNARFEQDARFAGTTFQQFAEFMRTTFQRMASFSDAAFQQSGTFLGAKFTQVAHFDNGRFDGLMMFQHAKFDQKVSFAGAKVRARMQFDSAEVNSWVEFDDAVFEAGGRLSFKGIDVRPGGSLKLTIDQIGRRRERLIEGEDSDDKEKLKSAAAQYNMLRDNFRTLPSTDEEEDRCHYKYMDLRRRASNWRWHYRFADWFFLKWCWGYGIYVKRTIFSILLVILGFGLMYQLFAGPDTIRNYYVESASSAQGGTTSTADGEPKSEFNALYFSIITFTTIGYGDYAPLGWLRWVAGAEGLTGLFLMAVFTVSFARKFIR